VNGVEVLSGVYRSYCSTVFRKKGNVDGDVPPRWTSGTMIYSDKMGLLKLEYYNEYTFLHVTVLVD
jgi:hypothetical protein